MSKLTSVKKNNLRSGLVYQIFSFPSVSLQIQVAHIDAACLTAMQCVAATFKRNILSAAQATELGSVVKLRSTCFFVETSTSLRVRDRVQLSDGVSSALLYDLPG